MFPRSRATSPKLWSLPVRPHTPMRRARSGVTPESQREVPPADCRGPRRRADPGARRPAEFESDPQRSGQLGQCLRVGAAGFGGSPPSIRRSSANWTNRLVNLGSADLRVGSRLLSTSSATTLTSALQTSSAASSVHPPEKTARSAEEALRVIQIQPAAPSNRRSKRSLMLGNIAWTAGKQRQALVVGAAAVLRRKRLDARGRELDRERQTKRRQIRRRPLQRSLAWPPGRAHRRVRRLLVWNGDHN